MEQDFETSSCRTLEQIRGSKIVSDNSPTVRIQGDCWPPYGEIITKSSLCWSSKLRVEVDYLEGKSALSFGLISPDERNEGQHRLTGKLWAWSSRSRKIFIKPFDSVANYGRITPITQFYNTDITSGSNLGVEFLFDRKSNTSRVHFTINGEDGWVSFGNGAPEVWYGYLRLSLEGNDSKIGVRVVSEKTKAYYDTSALLHVEPAILVTEENVPPCLSGVVKVGQIIHEVFRTIAPCPREKQIFRSPGTLKLGHYPMHSLNPRGICLLINNVPNLAVEEEKLSDLFSYLSFHVEVRRGLKMDEMNAVAREFAETDHSHFDIFAVVVMTIYGQGSKIYCADGRSACLEHVMMEYKATRCPSLKGKPKLFFIHRFSRRSRTVKHPCSNQVHGSCTENDVEKFPYRSIIAKDGCPEEADFLLLFVESTYRADENIRVSESIFIQMLDKFVRRYHHLYDLLEIFTLVNKQMVDRQNDRSYIQVPYLTYTLRAKVQLGLAPTSASTLSAVAQRDRYEMNRRPRGLCIIVNNVHFMNHNPNRSGAEEDEQNLKHLFKALSFKVVIRRDLSKHELENVAQEFGAKNHSAYNAFVFIVMSHGGDHDHILGVDGRETTVKNLMVEYLEDKCPSLKDKPKVFIIQSCRGCLVDSDTCSMRSSVNGINSQMVAMSSQAQRGSHPCPTAFIPDSTLPRSVFPTGADFILAFASAPGYESYRDKKLGTWFIQTVVEVIREYHHCNHFLDMLTEVTRLVVKHGNSVQVPAPVDTLTKLLYL